MGVLTRVINVFEENERFQRISGRRHGSCASPPLYFTFRKLAPGYSQTLALEWIQRGAVLRG